MSNAEDRNRLMNAKRNAGNHIRIADWIASLPYGDQEYARERFDLGDWGFEVVDWLKQHDIPQGTDSLEKQIADLDDKPRR